MRVMPVLLTMVAMVLIGACGNANQKTANSELSECVTTLVFIATSHTHGASLGYPTNSVHVSTPVSGVNIADALNGHCEGFIDSDLLATLQSGGGRGRGGQVLPQAPPISGKGSLDWLNTPSAK